MRVVFDTNVLVAAARSQRGASFALIRMLPSDKFQICISNALYFEYLDVLLRPEVKPPNMADAEMIAAVDAITESAFHQEIFFRWRPWLKDRGDDFVLELAIASQSNFIVTFNTKGLRKDRTFRYRGDNAVRFSGVRQRENRMSTITIEIPNSLRERLEIIAKDEGIALNDLIVEMVGKISANPVLERIKQNAQRQESRAAFEKFLASVPDVEPIHPDDVVKK